MIIVIGRDGRERHEDDSYRLKDGEAIRCPLYMMDSLQRAVASWSPFVEVERQRAFSEMIAADRDAWRRPVKDEAEAVPKVSDDPRQQAFFEGCWHDRNAWKRRQPVVAAPARDDAQTPTPTPSPVPAVAGDERA